MKLHNVVIQVVLDLLIRSLLQGIQPLIVDIEKREIALTLEQSLEGLLLRLERAHLGF
jgi:hypothetical protein